MEACVQSGKVSRQCARCGRKAEKMHRPLFHRGVFCSCCCPVCANEPNPPLASPLKNVLAEHSTTQWKDGGWGPRRDARGKYVDPWYRDERQLPPRWIPRRPGWFK